MRTWLPRALSQLTALVAFALIAEVVGMLCADAIGGVMGEPYWQLVDRIARDGGIVVGALVKLVPFAIGVVVALPVYRYLSGLGWPGRLSWGTTLAGGAGLIVIGWGAFMMMLGGYVTPAEMSVLLMAALVLLLSALTIRAQARAERLAAPQDMDAFD